MAQGEIKEWSSSKGEGMILQDGGEDVWLRER